MRTLWIFLVGLVLMACGDSDSRGQNTDAGSRDAAIRVSDAQSDQMVVLIDLGAAADAEPEPDPCAPDCGSKACGPDGCGGECGACGVGTMCVEHQCVGNETTWPNLNWAPAEPTSGQGTQALVEDTSPWVYVGLHVLGGCGPVGTSLLGAEEISNGVWRWTFDVDPMAAGDHVVTFTRDNDQVVVLSETLAVGGDATCPAPSLLCPEPGVPCEDHYDEVQICGGTGASVSVPCHKFGTCMAAGDGTQCSWGEGSFCEDPCGDAPPETGDVCAAEGLPCTDDYQTAKVCEASGQSVTIQCHKVGTCMGPGDGTWCSWGEGSFCEDPCAGVVTSQPPPDNRFGIGLVGPGDDNQLNLVKDLTGAGGHALLIFPGVQISTTGPDPAWVAAAVRNPTKATVQTTVTAPSERARTCSCARPGRSSGRCWPQTG